MGIRSRFVRDCEGKQMLIDKIFYYIKDGVSFGGGAILGLVVIFIFVWMGEMDRNGKQPTWCAME